MKVLRQAAHHDGGVRTAFPWIDRNGAPGKGHSDRPCCAKVNIAEPSALSIEELGLSKCQCFVVVVVGV